MCVYSFRVRRARSYRAPRRDEGKMCAITRKYRHCTTCVHAYKQRVIAHIFRVEGKKRYPHHHCMCCVCVCVCTFSKYKKRASVLLLKEYRAHNKLPFVTRRDRVANACNYILPLIYLCDFVIHLFDLFAPSKQNALVTFRPRVCFVFFFFCFNSFSRAFLLSRQIPARIYKRECGGTKGSPCW